MFSLDKSCTPVVGLASGRNMIGPHTGAMRLAPGSRHHDAALKAASEAAKDAAPYIHPRLSAVEHTDDQIDSFAEFLKTIGDSARDLPDPARIPPDRGGGVIDVTPVQGAPEPQTPSLLPPPTESSPYWVDQRRR
jgi:hypothetical protein